MTRCSDLLRVGRDAPSHPQEPSGGCASLRLALPAGVLALDGWADRLIVLTNCAWALLTACHAIHVHRKLSAAGAA
ncbi:MAG TPA: hypothetical protein VGS27_10990 [Candidatus Sulfotelmatobacter sp.]|nr:hypothetical protein [Candidatus Sulfotelmatobacter sp.]